MTSALLGGVWSASGPCSFTAGVQWIEGWVGPRAGLDTMEGRKILSLSGTRTPTIQPVVSRFTDCAIPAHMEQLVE
jgi:hypothetical protein